MSKMRLSSLHHVLAFLVSPPLQAVRSLRAGLAEEREEETLAAEVEAWVE